MADRLERSIGAVRDAVHPEWSDAHAGRLITRVRARARRRRVATGAALCALFLFAGAAVQWALPNPDGGANPDEGANSEEGAGLESPLNSEEPVPSRAPLERSPLRFADGTVVELLTPESEIVVERVDVETTHLRVVRGGGRFTVEPGLPRLFRVSAGEVDVAVIGTVFEVSRDHREAEVRVLRGRVRVSWPPDHAVDMTPGQTRRFPLEAPVASAVRTAALAPIEASVERDAIAPARERDPLTTTPDSIASMRDPIASTRAPREPDEDRALMDDRVAPEATGWRALAEEGRYDEAAELLAQEVDRIPANDIDGLLLAADTMRLAGRPAIALGLLERAESGPTDARAALVSFTKGRLLLTSLSRPGDAAAAFARARAIAPTGAVAADSLAREVEARARAGDAAGARARAEEYLRLYPHGVAIESVRRHGGLSSP
jgi:transmembrane sensor